MAKYRVYANYVFSKIIAKEIEAKTEEEAIQKALEIAEPDAHLCHQCSKDFTDSGVLDEESCDVELLD